MVNRKMGRTAGRAAYFLASSTWSAGIRDGCEPTVDRNVVAKLNSVIIGNGSVKLRAIWDSRRDRRGRENICLLLNKVKWNLKILVIQRERDGEVEVLRFYK